MGIAKEKPHGNLLGGGEVGGVCGFGGDEGGRVKLQKPKATTPKELRVEAEGGGKKTRSVWDSKGEEWCKFLC